MIQSSENVIDFFRGRKWYHGFTKRYPTLSERKAQFMNMARAQKLN